MRIAANTSFIFLFIILKFKRCKDNHFSSIFLFCEVSDDVFRHKNHNSLLSRDRLKIKMQYFITEQVYPHLGAFILMTLMGIGGFIFGRRKQRAETETIEVNNDAIGISNADKIVGMYQNTFDDLQLR